MRGDWLVSRRTRCDGDSVVDVSKPGSRSCCCLSSPAVRTSRLFLSCVSSSHRKHERDARRQTLRHQDDREQRCRNEGSADGPGHGKPRARRPRDPLGSQATGEPVSTVCLCVSALSVRLLCGVCPDQHGQCGLHPVWDPAEGGLPVWAHRLPEQRRHETPEGHLFPQAH